ncbi:MAG: glycosyltransferase family 2 protein [Candidatus Pacebacteria bacterium]|nr:glycosyltransferase family 2 protein [Candidatus Paceibacterota bacterium]
MKKTPAVSIIVLNWNGKKWLKECFSSIYKQNFKDFEVILADNNSSDSSVEYTRKNWPKVKIIELSKNFGYAEGNNKAAKISQGEFLLFLNNDTKIQNNFLEKLYRSAQKEKDAILTPTMLGYNGEKIFPEDKKYLGIDRFGYPLLAKKPFYADGAALFIKKTIFKELYGFDKDYFMFQEDIDLSWRARLLGYNIIPVLSAEVYHFCGGTAGGSRKNEGRHKTSTFRRYHTEKNSLSNLLKNYEYHNILISVPIFLLLGWGEAFLYFLTGQFSASIAILKAHFWNLVNIKKTFAKRKKIQTARKINDKQIMKHMSKGSGKWEVLKKIGIPNVQ